MNQACAISAAIAVLVFSLAAEAEPQVRHWQTTVTHDPVTVHAAARSVSGRELIDVGCNAVLGPGMHATLTGYGGNRLRRADDQSEPVFFTLTNADGVRRPFSVQMHYFAPDKAWVLSDPLPVDFIMQFGRNDRLAVENNKGEVVTEFELKGADVASKTILESCKEQR